MSGYWKFSASKFAHIFSTLPIALTTLATVVVAQVPNDPALLGAGRPPRVPFQPRDLTPAPIPPRYDNQPVSVEAWSCVSAAAAEASARQGLREVQAVYGCGTISKISCTEPRSYGGETCNLTYVRCNALLGSCGGEVPRTVFTRNPL